MMIAIWIMEVKLSIYMERAINGFYFIPTSILETSEVFRVYLSIALVEESIKVVGGILLFLLLSKAFKKSIWEFILYSCLAFAVVELIVYAIDAYHTSCLTWVLISRIFVSIPFHLITGFLLIDVWKKGFPYILSAFLFLIVWHMLYNVGLAFDYKAIVIIPSIFYGWLKILKRVEGFE